MKYCLSGMLIFAVIAFASCDNEKDATPDVQALLTSGSWRMSNVTVDGVNKNALFPNLFLSFSDGAFSASNGDPVWPASGNWTFAGTDQRTIIRNDGVEVTVNEITESELILTLHWTKTTLGGGREKSLQGSHVFTFGK